MALGKTQTEFGTLLGKGIATIQRYETLVPPKGKVLAQLEQLAHAHGYDEYAAIFRTALAVELGIQGSEIKPRPAATLISGGNPLLDFTPEEKVMAAALLLVMRHPKYESLRSTVRTVLRDPIEVSRKGLEFADSLSMRPKAAQRLLASGRGAEANPAVLATVLATFLPFEEKLRKSLEERSDKLPPAEAAFSKFLFSVRIGLPDYAYASSMGMPRGLVDLLSDFMRQQLGIEVESLVDLAAWADDFEFRGSVGADIAVRKKNQ